MLLWLTLTPTIDVDLSEATEAAVASGDYFIFLDGGATGTAKKENLNDLTTSLAGAGLSASGITLALDIDGLDALGGTGLHQTQDHFVFSNNGTEQKITFSNLEDAIFGNVSGDATIAAGGALTLGAGTVEHGMLNDNIVSGQTAITTVAQADLLMVDDGPGEVKKITFSNFEDQIFGNVSGDIAIAAGGAVTIQANSIALGTDTTGDYVSSLVAGTLIDLQNNSGETATPTIDVDLSEAAEAAIANGDYILFLDGGATGTAKKEALADLITLIAGTEASTGLTASGSVLTVSDLHSVGVNGSAGDFLTDAGDGTITANSDFNYNSETLLIGADDDGGASIRRSPHSDGNGGNLSVYGGQGQGTNANGGNLNLLGGTNAGSGSAGIIKMYNNTVQHSEFGLTYLSLLPHGTDAGYTRELRFLELAAGGTNYTGFKSPDALAGNTIYTLPTAFPASNKVLQSTDAGVLSWEASSGLITGIANGADNRLTYWSGSDTLQGNSNITITSDNGITMAGTLQAEQITSTDEISLPATGRLEFDGSGGHTYINESSADNLRVVVGGQVMMDIDEANNDVEIKLGVDLIVHPVAKLYLDGGSHTYIQEVSADTLVVYVGGTRFMYLDENGGGTGSGADIAAFPAIDLVCGSTAPVTAGTGNLNDFTVHHAVSGSTTADGHGGITINNTDTSVAADQHLGGIAFTAHGDGGVEDDMYKAPALIAAHASEAFASTQQGSRLSFWVKTNGVNFDAAPTERMRLEQDGDLHVDADVVAYSSTVSDIRLKHDINPLESSLSIINKLNPVTYKWKHRKDDTKDHPGLIAQEVEEILPGIINETTMPFHAEEGDNTIYKSVRYTELIPHLIGAIKEQQSQIDELKSEIKKLKDK